VSSSVSSNVLSSNGVRRQLSLNSRAYQQPTDRVICQPGWRSVGRAAVRSVLKSDSVLDASRSEHVGGLARRYRAPGAAECHPGWNLTRGEPDHASRAPSATTRGGRRASTRLGDDVDSLDISVPDRATVRMIVPPG